MCTRRGTQRRDVECIAVIDGNASVVDLSMCKSLSAMPITQQECVLPTSVSSPVCGCVLSSECNQVTMQCVSGSCVCLTGWGSVDCSVPLLNTLPGEDCVDGVVDVAGLCCHGHVDFVTGHCCTSVGAVADVYGRCCDAGVVDACGDRKSVV